MVSNTTSSLKLNFRHMLQLMLTGNTEAEVLINNSPPDFVRAPAADCSILPACINEVCRSACTVYPAAVENALCYLKQRHNAKKELGSNKGLASTRHTTNCYQYLPVTEWHEIRHMLVYLPGLVWLHNEGVAGRPPLFQCMCHHNKPVCKPESDQDRGNSSQRIVLTDA